MEKNNSLNKNSLLVLGAMVANGFKPGDCNKILELFQPASDSISQHLNQFEQFLLSKNVNYDDLKRYNIKGACGYLDEKDGIFIKNTTKSNKYFDVYESKVMCQPNNWNYPTISEFDSVIAYHTWDDLEEIKQLQALLYYYNIKTHYIGFINDSDDKNLAAKVNLYRTLLEAINRKTLASYKIIHESDRKVGKDLYLIKKK